jgi:hypothetical protein
MKVIEMTDAQLAEQLRLADENGDKAGVDVWHGEIYARARKRRSEGRKAMETKPCPSMDGKN